MKLLELTQGYSTIIDDEDYEYLRQWKWYYKDGYAIRSERFGPRKEGKSKTIRLHRVLLNNPDLQVDHINGDRLDNRRNNLRLANDIQNAQNRSKRKDSLSKYKGVSWHKKYKRWQVRIKLVNVRLLLGYFDSELEAAKAYNEAAIKYHGEFARINKL